MTPQELKELFRKLAVESAELKQASGANLTDVVAGWLVPQYLCAARERLATLTNGMERWKLLRVAANDLVALRRGDHSAARLELECEKFEETRRRQRTREEQQLPREKPNGLTVETLKRIEEELHLI